MRNYFGAGDVVVWLDVQILKSLITDGDGLAGEITVLGSVLAP